MTGKEHLFILLAQVMIARQGGGRTADISTESLTPPSVREVDSL